MLYNYNINFYFQFFIIKIENNNYKIYKKVKIIIINYNYMDNFFNLLSNNDFYIDKNEKKKEIYNRYCHLNRYLKLNLLEKNKLIEIINKLAQYTEKKEFEYKDFKFGNKIICLDEQQQKIIVHDPYHHFRIIACAGSGKTTTILCRIKYLLENYILPDKILILTFNRDACDNLKNRIYDLFGFYINIEIRTIDSFAAKIYHKYSENKVKFTAISELCIFALKILQQHGDKICKQYAYIFFDEFQDIDNIQFDILKQYVNNGCYLTVIGDDNQNIYQWRGSDNFYMINYDLIFENTITYPIFTNYRSIKSIIMLANASISNNNNQIKKDMKSKKDSKIRPKLILYKDAKTQCREIIKRMTYLVDNFNYQFDDFAILSRNGTYLKLFEEYLCKYNKEERLIPYMALISDDKNDTKPVLSKGHITISTIHKSKGLEWKAVFIIGLHDKYFPCFMNNNFLNIEEERRLFYVGVTRAIEYLYFVVNPMELPVSRFISEVKDYFDYENQSKLPIYEDIKEIFGQDNESIKITGYSVTEAIKLLKSSDFNDLREMKLLTDIEVEEILLFDKELYFNDEIKKNNFESDFGDFCDRIITRKITEFGKNNIGDMPAYQIIEATYLTKEEIELLQQNQIHQLIRIYDKNEILEILNNVIYDTVRVKLTNIINKINFNKDILNKIVREHTYPDHFLKKLKDSYNKYINKENITDNILDDIYNVGLCGKFIDNRRRLVYRNIYNIFMNSIESIKERIDLYTEQIKVDENICKVTTQYKWKDNEYYIAGELDMINITKKELIDFKCSGSNFKMEWYIQLLLYYSLLKINKKTYDIQYLSIFNILKGKVYKIKLDNFDYQKFINFFSELIENEVSNKRHKPLNLDILLENNNEISEIKNIYINKRIVKENIDQSHYMVLDTETTGFDINTDDILQIAYNIYDENFNIIKRINKYIINEYCLISDFNTKIHGIDNDIIKEKGRKFNYVINDFIDDLYNIKYIVGHNINYDLSIIETNLYKYKSEFINIFRNKTIICTKKKGKNICNLMNSIGRPKNPSLQELYYYLFKENIIDAHNAQNDVDACARCFLVLEKRRLKNIKMKSMINDINLKKILKYKN
jgi:DNA polymerase III epsilon subunit-like protein